MCLEYKILSDGAPKSSTNKKEPPQRDPQVTNTESQPPVTRLPAEAGPRVDHFVKKVPVAVLNM